MPHIMVFYFRLPCFHVSNSVLSFYTVRWYPHFFMDIIVTLPTLTCRCQLKLQHLQSCILPRYIPWRVHHCLNILEHWNILQHTTSVFLVIQKNCLLTEWLIRLHSFCNLRHWGQYKVATISQTTFSKASSGMNMYEFRLKVHWISYLRVELTIFPILVQIMASRRLDNKPLFEAMTT